MKKGAKEMRKYCLGRRIFFGIFFMIFLAGLVSATYNLTLTEVNSTFAVVNIVNAVNVYAYEANLNYTGTIGAVSQSNFLGGTGVASYGSNERDGILSVYGSKLDAAKAGVSNASTVLFNVTHSGGISLMYLVEINSSGFESYGYFNGSSGGTTTCSEGASQSCSVGGSCAGTQTCSGGAWSACVKTDPNCGSDGGGCTGPDCATPREAGINITVAPEEFNIQTTPDEIINKDLQITNNEAEELTLNIGKTNSLEGSVFFEMNELVIPSGESVTINARFSSALKNLTIGKILIKKGNLAAKEIPVVITVKSKNFLFDSSITIPPEYKNLAIGKNLFGQVSLVEVGLNEKVDVVANYLVEDFDGNNYLQEKETFSVEGEKKFLKEFDTSRLSPGKYVLGLEVLYPGAFATSSAQFQVVEPQLSWLSRLPKVAGLSQIASSFIWIIIFIAVILGLGVLAYFGLKKASIKNSLENLKKRDAQKKSNKHQQKSKK